MSVVTDAALRGPFLTSGPTSPSRTTRRPLRRSVFAWLPGGVRLSLVRDDTAILSFLIAEAHAPAPPMPLHKCSPELTLRHGTGSPLLEFITLRIGDDGAPPEHALLLAQRHSRPALRSLSPTTFWPAHAGSPSLSRPRPTCRRRSLVGEYPQMPPPPEPPEPPNTGQKGLPLGSVASRPGRRHLAHIELLWRDAGMCCAHLRPPFCRARAYPAPPASTSSSSAPSPTS